MKIDEFSYLYPQTYYFMRNFLFFPLFLCAMLFSCNSENEVNPSIDPPQEEMGLESIQLEKDFQITPTGGAASEAQGG